MHKAEGTYAIQPFLLTVTRTPLTCKQSEALINNSSYIIADLRPKTYFQLMTCELSFVSAEINLD